MATTNTAFSWYWYIRKKGKRYYLGIVNNNGSAPASALTAQIFVDNIPSEISSEDSEIPVPKQFELWFIKGCVAEIMKMDAKPNVGKIGLFNAEYEQAKYQALHRQIKETSQPAIIKPFDLRDD